MVGIVERHLGIVRGGGGLGGVRDHFLTFVVFKHSKARTCLPLPKAPSTRVSLNMRRSLFFSLSTPGLVL